jgi:Uma2 family endonuclease
LFEPELRLGADVVDPDLAGWRAERFPHRAESGPIEVPPDWVCEILSPSTMRIDRAAKPPVYARAKVMHIWIIHPIARTLEVFRLVGEHYLMASTHAGDERVRAEPFDAVELDMTNWWGGPEESEPK